MKRRFILYKITQNISDDFTLIYVKEIRSGKVIYTTFSADAKRYPLSRAFLLSVYFGLSHISERLA